MVKRQSKANATWEEVKAELARLDRAALVMARTCVIFAMALLSASAWSQLKNQTSAPPTPFVIDQNRHYVYLRFDHMGAGEKFSDDEPPKRVWFWFVNNCGVGVVLRTFGVPEGSPKDEVGVMHDVVKDVPKSGVIHVNNPPELNKGSSDLHRKEKIPTGYDSDVSSSASIPPGQSVLFSVPVTHLGRSWHIEIPYTFDLPSGKVPRPPTVGGEPRMVLLYYVWDLPEDIQQELLKMR